MKNITPISIWINGSSKEASTLTAMIVGDDLRSSCTFYYELRETNTIIQPLEEGGESTIIPGEVLAMGNIVMGGTEYQNWDGSNDAAYTYIVNQLNLTIQQ